MQPMRATVALCLIAAFASMASAQQRPGGNGPLPGDPGYGDPGPQYSPPPAPSGHWVTTWGAFATDNVRGILGTVTGYASKDDASRAAVEACRAKGGTECRLDLAYYNQCAVMIVGVNYLRFHGAATVEEATATGMKACSDADSNWPVYFSECSLPPFVSY